MMHFEKNLINNHFGEEYTVVVRRDMVVMNIHSLLWRTPMGNGELALPPALYVMTLDE
jgi:hypothetical protein